MLQHLSSSEDKLYSFTRMSQHQFNSVLAIIYDILISLSAMCSAMLDEGDLSDVLSDMFCKF